jgi:hypothetical protein
MAKYKKYSYEQARFNPIHFDKQILPDTFECTLSYLIDNEIYLSIFDNRHQNDENGDPAYDLAILLKMILFFTNASTAELIGEWLSPSNGKVLKGLKLKTGQEALEVPSFNIDLALLITSVSI